MSITSGFFNSNEDGDRAYTAEEMSSIFDGIIQDGIYMSIGEALRVKHRDNNTVTVSTGRAWFNHTWTFNDALLPVTLEAAPLLNSRIDAIVLEINSGPDVRKNSIKVIKGTVAAKPVNPTLIKSVDVNQYPLAYIKRNENSLIKPGDITNMVGTSATPFVTGVIAGMDIDFIVAQWQSQWVEIRDQTELDIREFMQNVSIEFYTWQTAKKAEFEDWVESIKQSLDGDPATSLAKSIADLRNDFNDEKSINVVSDTRRRQHVGTMEPKVSENGDLWARVKEGKK